MPEKERLYRVEAIILKRWDMGEADRLLTLYTREHGKVRAIAKGARRTTSRKSGHVELFMRSQMLIARGRELDIITQAEVIEPYLALREDLGRVSYACYAAELLDSFAAEGEEHRPLYDLLADALAWIAEADDLDLAMRLYELRLLDYVGFRPELFHCLRCRAGLQPEPNYFSLADGGVVCPKCAQGASGLEALALNPLKVLRFFQTHDYQLCRDIHIHPGTHRQLERLMQRYIVYHLERQLKSTAFIQLLRQSG